MEADNRQTQLQVDPEWTDLILEALGLGLEPREIRKFLRLKRNSRNRRNVALITLEAQGLSEEDP